MANSVRRYQLESEELLILIKNLLGAEAEALRKVLVRRSRAARGKTIVIPLGPATVGAVVDSFAEGAYGR